VILCGLATAQTVKSIALSETSVAGGATLTGTVTLSADAGSGGKTVSLSSSNAAAKVSASVKVPSGSKTATFTVSTTAVNANTNATIKGTIGSSSATATLTVLSPKLTSLTLSPTSVLGGTVVTGTVGLGSEAPSSGTQVKLSSTLTAATVPPSVTVEAGAKSATFSIKTLPVAQMTTPEIKAVLGSALVGEKFTIDPPAITAIKLNPPALAGGSSSTGTLTLNGPAPSGGFKIVLSTNQSNVNVPADVTISSEAKTATFTLSTKAVNQIVETATIKAVDPEAKTAQAELKILGTYYPFETGKTWTYDYSSSLGTSLVTTITCQGLGKIKGVSAIELTWETPGESLWYNPTNPMGLVKVAEVDDETDPVQQYSPALILIPTTISTGATWTQNTTEIYYKTNGSVGAKEPLKATGTVVGFETLKVPAGTFKNVLHVHISGARTNGTLSINDDYWYGYGIGLLESITRETDSAGTLTKTYQLKSFAW
jgi:hypothetical protein